MVTGAWRAECQVGRATKLGRLSLPLTRAPIKWGQYRTWWAPNKLSHSYEFESCSSCIPTISLQFSQMQLTWISCHSLLSAQPLSKHNTLIFQLIFIHICNYPVFSYIRIKSASHSVLSLAYAQCTHRPAIKQSCYKV